MLNYNDRKLYELIDMKDMTLPIIIHEASFKHDKSLINNNCFPLHWHDKIELLLITEGKGAFVCNSLTMDAVKGDIIIFNNNDLHQGKCTTDILEYYCIIIDVSILLNRYHDICEYKYLKPISVNLVLFENKISQDSQLRDILLHIVNEYLKKNTAYEMAIKSSVLNMFVYLLRNYVKTVLSDKENHMRKKNIARFNIVLDYISKNYKSVITIAELSSHINLSKYHFCRLFKELTGCTVSVFINEYRINNAKELLQNTDKNVSEVAFESGFNDVNYFSRQFKNIKGYPPSQIIKQRETRGR